MKQIRSWYKLKNKIKWKVQQVKMKSQLNRVIYNVYYNGDLLSGVSVYCIDCDKFYNESICACVYADEINFYRNDLLQQIQLRNKNKMCWFSDNNESGDKSTNK